MGRAKTRKARKQAAFEARRRGITLARAKKALKVGWLKLPDAIHHACLVCTKKPGQKARLMGIATGWSMGEADQNQNRWTWPGGSTLPPSGGCLIVGMDHGVSGGDYSMQSIPRAGRGPADPLLIDAETFFAPQDKSATTLQAVLAQVELDTYTLTIPASKIKVGGDANGAADAFSRYMVRSDTRQMLERP